MEAVREKVKRGYKIVAQIFYDCNLQKRTKKGKPKAIVASPIIVKSAELGKL